MKSSQTLLYFKLTNKTFAVLAQNLSICIQVIDELFFVFILAFKADYLITVDTIRKRELRRTRLTIRITDHMGRSYLEHLLQG